MGDERSPSQVEAVDNAGDDGIGIVSPSSAGGARGGEDGCEDVV